jgi:imidazolonepropionase-like amidohydrolase
MFTTLPSRVLMLLLALVVHTASAQVAVKAKKIYTMSQAGVITDGVIVVTDGKIVAVGSAANVTIPDGHRIVEAAVAVPGLIDARSTVGVSGMLNQRQDQDQLETSAPVQPELRAIDAFNPLDPLVAWVRSLGVTSVHTGHAPGELISGQTAVIKTSGRPIDESVVKEIATVAATLGPQAARSGGSAPGTRAKMMAMLREEFVRAQAYTAKRNNPAMPAPQAPQPTPDAAGVTSGASPQQPDASSGSEGRNLRLETLAQVLAGEVPLLITVNNSQDIASALRLAREFEIKIILDGAAEAYTLIDEIKEAGVPVIVHPSMVRAYGEMQNISMETCAKLINAGVLVGMQSGYETYVPKSRIVLFEAAIAAANGCTFEQALSTVTTGPAKILGIADRVGSLTIGLDGDISLFDGDPFEYTTHCTPTIIGGTLFSGT